MSNQKKASKSHDNQSNVYTANFVLNNFINVRENIVKSKERFQIMETNRHLLLTLALLTQVLYVYCRGPQQVTNTVIEKTETSNDISNQKLGDVWFSSQATKYLP